jgi:flavin-dependent dehydrogenase
LNTCDSIVDVLITGAGPAGLTAALRLQQLGYRVQLLESSALWPRSHVGEALTPGIKNIIDLLQASDALASVPHLANMPTRMCWKSIEPEWVESGDSAIVSRAHFDAALMACAQERGVFVAQPASIKRISGVAGDWTIEFIDKDILRTAKAKFILDATGRSGHQQFACSARLSAMWAEIPGEDLPKQLQKITQVEALESGWLWGSCLPNQHYRVMWVGDPHSPRKFISGRPDKWLRAQCSTSQLFHTIAQAPFTHALNLCAATPYISLDAWREGRIKLGDAAFSLDPISSSGVEKAMRFSLAAVVAIHTILSNSSHAYNTLAKDFFQERLLETSARHSYWTRSYYAQTWCQEKEFWQLRSQKMESFFSLEKNAPGNHKEIIDGFKKQIAYLENYNPPALKPLSQLDMTRLLCLDAGTNFVETHCVIDNQVKIQRAVNHSAIERPVAYLEGEPLLPHLDLLKQPQTLSSLLTTLSHKMTAEKAQKITAWLWQNGIISSI